MIDNLEKIIPLLKFESEDDFYYLQILQRKKENPQLGSNSRVIKNYYITSVDYLLNRYDEIKTLCDIFNARDSVRLNKRSYEKVGIYETKIIRDLQGWTLKENKTYLNDDKCFIAITEKI